MEHDKTNILSLPPEVFESIAERVPEQDLPALRLACRDISRKTHRTFVNTHFTHKFFLLDSPSSIKAAVKIAQHLSFGPAFRNLTFVIDQIPDIRTKPPPRSHTEANHPKRLKTGSQLREQLWNHHQPFRNATVQKRVLTGLFDLLKDHGSLTTIRFAQAFMADRQPVFNGKSVFKLKDPELDYTEDDILNERLEPESAIQMVLEAINRSGITSIQGIHMDNIGAIILDGMSPTTIKIYETAFRSLKSLSLSVVKLSFYWGHEASQEDVRDFCKAMTQAPTLEYLSFNIGRDYEDPFDEEEFENIDDSIVVDALMQETLPSLKKLHLDWPSIQMDRLLAFLHRHKTLEVLTLNYAIFDEVSFTRFAREGESVKDVLLRLTCVKEVITDHDTEELRRDIW